MVASHSTFSYGKHESQHSSHPAFLGSCNSAQILVYCLVPNFDVIHPFQERSFPSLILKIYPSCHLIYLTGFPWWSVICQYFQLHNNLGPSSFMCCRSFFRYQQWVAQGHPSTTSRLGLFFSWLYYCSSFMVRCYCYHFVLVCLSLISLMTISLVVHMALYVSNVMLT